MMRVDSLHRTIIEDRMEGRKTRRRPKRMLLDWITRKGSSKAMEEAQHHGEWYHQTFVPAHGPRTKRRIGLCKNGGNLSVPFTDICSTLGLMVTDMCSNPDLIDITCKLEDYFYGSMGRL